jgi:SNF2 family DNA or RNA helicase
MWTLVMQLSNEVAVPKSYNGSWSEPRYRELQTHKMQTNNKLIRTAWEFCFNVIAGCNDVIYEVSNSGEMNENKEKIIAEMKVLRAYCYMMAMDCWGNIPYSVDKKQEGYPDVKGRDFFFPFIEKEIKDNIDKRKMANNPLAELIRMRQATGYTGILSSTISESAKIDRLEEIVEESVANNKKVVIFSNWTQMTTPVHNRLAKNYKGLVITGETNDVDRQAYVNHFQTDPECKYILGTIGAMGTGLTLTAGTVVVFLDEPWTMANKQQAIDRCHRIGTTSNITVITIMCKNTIDERIHEIVEKKGVMADALVDGKIAGNKMELLNFLLS